MAWFKFALQNSGLIKAGFSFTMLIVETRQKNGVCPLFQRVVVFVHSNVETPYWTCQDVQSGAVSHNELLSEVRQKLRRCEVRSAKKSKFVQ